MNGYLFGSLDYADGQLLKFLRTKEVRVRQLLTELSDDRAIAERLIQESRRSSEEITRWNRRFRLMNAPFIAMWEADEGQRASGVGTNFLKVFYNYVLMPPVYLIFRIAKRLRRDNRP